MRFLTFGMRGQARGRIDGHAAVGGNESRAKRQRGDMPFADRAQAEDEATPARRRAGLVRMGDDARIEQCRRLERIFVQEIRADQLALDLGEDAWTAKAPPSRRRAPRTSPADCGGAPGSSPGHRPAGCSGHGGSSASTRSTMWFARVLSVGLRSRGSVAGLNGRTTTRAGSGRRYRACRFRNVGCDKRNLGSVRMRARGWLMRASTQRRRSRERSPTQCAASWRISARLSR